ncbi:DUF6058 family natural product biosynthesis protein [Flavobacterium sp. IB48]|uniref:DUF6058 family natural product biosynthesis protein n=1 Tax=Flavobacterium sp. IB48 TaxID=2779375 RepID=UPI0018E728F1|nr:DUF6058 family natural product biosynthesis protein [Flavobacterium sp. IB48]MBJ2123251.1 hypothetical protein [Flavobacterium sp. IB48]
MRDENLAYIVDNYLEFEEVKRLTGLSDDELNKLIEEKLIPSPSYVINSEITISSPLNDQHTLTISKRYFAKNIVNLIKKNNKESYGELKKEFKENLLLHLKNHHNKGFAYGNVFDENGEIDPEKAENALEEEWNYYCKGVYGICTLNNDENAIIDKEIAIKRILDFIAKKSSSQTVEEENYLKELNDELNESTSLFAPYQRELSSRGKYLDKLLREFSLDDLIKKYD